MKKTYTCEKCLGVYDTAEDALYCEEECGKAFEEIDYVLCFNEFFVGALDHVDDDFLCSFYKLPFESMSEEKQIIQAQKKTLGKFGKLCKIRKIRTYCGNDNTWEFLDAETTR